MKSKIIIYMASLACLILAASCSTHDMIIKRHYMKGYYVGKHEKPHAPEVARAENKETKSAEHAQKLTMSLSPEKIEEPVLGQRYTGDIEPRPVSKRAAGNAKIEATHMSSAKPAVHLKEMIALKKPLASDRDGLSLFWIVILVILVLWAIGFLAGGLGLGGLINLLLLVALILLILWLLKII